MSMEVNETNYAKTVVLKDTDVFRDLTEKEVEFVTRIMSAREFEAGAVIMREGEVGHSLYIMGSGRVEVNKALTMKFGEDDFRETEKTLLTLSADQHSVFGEMALVAEAVRSATITALSDCVLYEISREDFLELAREHPALGFKVTLRIAALLSKRLKIAGEDVVRLTTALSIALSR